MKKDTVSKFFDVSLFVFLTVFFVFSYYAVGRWDVYTVSPQESGDAQQSSDAENTFTPAFEDNSSRELPLITETCTVRVYKGGIGVYDCNGELVECFEADISLLPSDDRKNLETGIMFDSERDMREFLESFDS